MPEIDGLELLERLKGSSRTSLVVVMTAFSSVESAVAALRMGAYDYVVKRSSMTTSCRRSRTPCASATLRLENRSLRRELDRAHSFDQIVGSSDALQELLTLVAKSRGRTQRF
jgi:DNA-binding NtrC family response regulator